MHTHTHTQKNMKAHIITLSWARAGKCLIRGLINIIFLWLPLKHNGNIFEIPRRTTACFASGPLNWTFWSKCLVCAVLHSVRPLLKRLPSVRPFLDNQFIYFFFVSYFFYCSGFCHTLKWNSHGFTCVPHPDPPSHLPLHPIPLGLPSAPGPSACLIHPTWTGDLFHPR